MRNTSPISSFYVASVTSCLIFRQTPNFFKSGNFVGIFANSIYKILQALLKIMLIFLVIACQLKLIKGGSKSVFRLCFKNTYTPEIIRRYTLFIL